MQITQCPISCSPTSIKTNDWISVVCVCMQYTCSFCAFPSAINLLTPRQISFTQHANLFSPVCCFTECLHMGRKQTAHNSLHIHTAPNTLTLHLKRFRPDFVKLTGHIAFPLTLNLAPFLSPDSPEQAPHSAFSQEPATCPHQQPAFPHRATGFAQKGHAFSEQRVTYRLIGVLVHKGSWSSAGHYFSYVLDSGELPPLLLRCSQSCFCSLSCHVSCCMLMLSQTYHLSTHHSQVPCVMPTVSMWLTAATAVLMSFIHSLS